MNEYEEALNIFCEQNVFKDISKDVLEEKYKLLKELVEKAIPKNINHDKWQGLCPNCKELIESNESAWKCSYCPYCGQALDWEEESED